MLNQLTVEDMRVTADLMARDPILQPFINEASKKVAEADYFLTGLIYSATEVASAGDPRGMRYFQFQFRVTDARTNIIVREKEYPVKRRGSFP